ncbi:carbonic anhydrase [Halobellus rarus]|uniref:carbonic anhydrase n=1 Tax=Halobellus rarus TaxID=1126237 RepID=A0ABD6CUP2_9EURY|nr:carbonic anhydrase [Halobellus rarus]
MESLERILAGNDEHVAQIDDDHFADVRDGQDPPVVSVSCSDSRVPAQGVWNARSDGDLFTSVNVGNQAWTDVDGERVVNDAVGYAVSALDVDLVAVLGHTGCGAVTAAYGAVFEEEDSGDLPPAVEAAVGRLVPVVEAAREEDVVGDATPTKAAVNRLVEYAVREQTTFLVDDGAVPDDVAVAGLVYDFQRAYGDDDGAAHLVSLDGETDSDRLRDRLDPAYHDHVGSLLE